MHRHRSLFTLALTILALTMAMSGCGGPEEKKQKFFARGQALYAEEDFVKARLEFKNALQVDPKFAQGYYMLGMAEMKLKNFSQAFGAFNKAVSLDDALTDAHLRLGLLLRMAGQLDEAMEKADLVLAREPENADARILKGAILMAKNDDKTVPYLEGLLQDGQDGADVYLMLASAQARGKQPGRAVKTLQQGIGKHPDHIPLHMGLAQLYAAGGQPARAEQTLKKICEMAPDKAVHQLNLARFYWSTDRRDEAEAVMGRLAEAYPDDEKVHLTAARFYLEAADLPRAQAALEAGIAALPDSIALHLTLAEVFQQRRQPRMAIETLEACLEKEAIHEGLNALAVKNALARVYLSMRQVDEADAYVDQVLAEKPGNIDAHFTRGSIFLFKGEGEQAVNAFRTVVDERPQLIPAHLGLADAHAAQGNPALAMDTLKSALKIDPENRDVRRSMARLFLRQGDRAAAEDQLRKIVAALPSDIRGHLELGDFLALDGRPDEAQTIYTQIVDTFSENPAGYIRLSRLRRSRGHVGGSVAILEQGLERVPGSELLLTALVQTCVAEKQHERAAAACEAFLKTSAKSVQAYNLLGYVYTAARDYARAEKMLQKAMALAPVNPAVHDNLARLYLLQGRKAEAVANLEAAIAAMPDSGKAYLTLALIHQQDKAYDQALAVYARALEHNPDFWFAMNNAAFLTGETTGDPAALEEALALANKALSRRPEDPSALDTVGWLHYRLGNVKRALGPIEQALEKAPDNSTILSHVGQVYAALNRPDEARETLEKALAAKADFIGRGEAERVLAEL